MRRKRAEAVLILCLAVSTFVFAFLWLAEKNSRDDVKELAQAAAADAYTAEPAKSQAHMADLVRMMKLLSEDAEDLNGHAQMLELRNALSHPE